MIKEFVYKEKPRKVLILKMTADFIEGLEFSSVEKALEKDTTLKPKWEEILGHLERTPLRESEDTSAKLADKNPDFEDAMKVLISSSYRRFSRKEINEAEDDEIRVVVVHCNKEELFFFPKNKALTKVDFSGILNKMKIDPASITQMEYCATTNDPKSIFKVEKTILTEDCKILLS